MPAYGPSDLSFGRGASPGLPTGDACASSAVHLVHLYEDGAYPADWCADFLSSGFGAGESGIVFATPEHVGSLKDALAIRGVPLDELERSNRFVVLDARRALGEMMKGRLPDPAKVAAGGAVTDAAVAAAPSGRVRIVSEGGALLVEDGNLAGALELERLETQVLASRPHRACCTYPIGLFGSRSNAGAFARVCEVHEDVIPILTWLDKPGYHGWCIANLQQLVRALQVEIAERAQADRRKDEFLAMLGHELRNPLAPIVTALDLMDARADPASERERAVIRRQAEHLSHLVSDLLDVSRIVRGKIELRKERTELSAVIEKAVEAARPLLDQRGHELSIHVPPDALAVEGDPFRLSQVFSNLLTNAAKYTDRGGRIAVTARRDGGEVVVDVSDTGCGIRPEMLSTIFEPFVQAERTVERARGGLGLGLALVKSLTELHGGSVSVLSDRPGQGSTFTIRLPALDAREAAPRPDEPVHGRQVLVVDDNHDAADTLALALEAAGHRVEVAYDGSDALARAARTPPDVALIDIGLPVMDGYEVAARLRADHRRPIRLIALTGYGQESDIERSRQAGFDLHLVKPVDLDTIVRALRG